MINLIAANQYTIECPGFPNSGGWSASEWNTSGFDPRKRPSYERVAVIPSYRDSGAGVRARTIGY